MNITPHADRSIAAREGAPLLPPMTGGGDGGFKIRPAEPRDLDSLIGMGRAFFHETGLPERYGVVFDEGSFAETLAVLGRNNLLLVAERSGEPVGMAALDVAQAYWNRALTLAQEAFWYLRPEHRVGHGARLLNALQDLAREKGAILFDVIAEEGKRSKALGRLYLTRGFDIAQTTYRRML